MAFGDKADEIEVAPELSLQAHWHRPLSVDGLWEDGRLAKAQRHCRF